MTDFASRKCVPCEGGVPKKTPAEVDEALRSLGGWDPQDGKTRIHKHYRFKDFVEAMTFVNALAALAEGEGHHPDFAVHWNRVDVTLWTHDAGGLTENDLVLAARVAALPEAAPRR